MFIPFQKNKSVVSFFKKRKQRSPKKLRCKNSTLWKFSVPCDHWFYLFGWISYNVVAICWVFVTCLLLNVPCVLHLLVSSGDPPWTGWYCTCCSHVIDKENKPWKVARGACLLNGVIWIWTYVCWASHFSLTQHTVSLLRQSLWWRSSSLNWGI